MVHANQQRAVLRLISMKYIKSKTIIKGKKGWAASILFSGSLVTFFIRATGFNIADDGMRPNIKSPKSEEYKMHQSTN